MITINAETFKEYIETDTYFTEDQKQLVYNNPTARLETIVEMFLGDAFNHAVDVAYDRAIRYIIEMERTNPYQ